MPEPKVVAGCISAYGPNRRLGYQQDDMLVPVGRELVAIQRSVLECVYAGAHCIWITCNGELMPFLKNLLGDYAISPIDAYNPFVRNFREYQTYIPIYYVPMNFRDISKRDSYAYGVINSARFARQALRKLSQFFEPESYYISFPYGVYDPQILQKYRAHIINPNKHVMVRYNNKTITDGEYLGLAIKSEDIDSIYRHIRKTEVGLYYGMDAKVPAGVPKWTGRWFGIDEIFGSFVPSNPVEYVDVEEYGRIDSWDGYGQYMLNVKNKPALDGLLKSQGHKHVQFNLNKTGINNPIYKEE